MSHSVIRSAIKFALLGASLFPLTASAQDKMAVVGKGYAISQVVGKYSVIQTSGVKLQLQNGSMITLTDSREDALFQMPKGTKLVTSMTDTTSLYDVRPLGKMPYYDAKCIVFIKGADRKYRPNSNGEYIPCAVYVEGIYPSGKFKLRVDRGLDALRPGVVNSKQIFFTYLVGMD